MSWSRRIGVDIVRAAIVAGALAPPIPAAHASSQPEQVVQLQPGAPLEGRLAGGDTRGYVVALSAGQSAIVVIAHRGIDLVVRARDPQPAGGDEISSDGPNGELRIRFQATGSELRGLEIAASYPLSPAGTYQVRVEVRRATAADEALAAAQHQQSLAGRLAATGAYAAAVPHAQQALSLHETALGPNAPEVGRSLHLLGQLHDALARYASAEGLYRRGLEVIGHARTVAELSAADILDSEAANYIARGKFSQAEPLVKEALATRERILGAGHIRVALSLGRLADLFYESARLQDASVTARRALDVASGTYKPGDTKLGEFINRVARSELAAANYSRAEQMYRQTLDATEKTDGADTLSVAESVGGLARVALLANDNVTSERLHLRSLTIRERVLGPDHPQVANDLFNLALIHYRRRDYVSALAIYGRALAIREKTFGRTHPAIAVTLNNIGLVYWRQQDYRRAEQFFQRAFELSEELYGADSLRVTNSLANLGIIAKETGDYTLAEVRYQRALAIKEKNLGIDHPDLITPIESLGILYRDRGDYRRAEEMFQRVIAISTASLGPEHPFVARHLDNVVLLNWASGNHQEAFTNLQRSLAIEERNLPLNLAVGSESQKLAYFEPFLRHLEETISFHVQQRPEDAATRDLAITTLLQRKGRVLDALVDNLAAFRNRASDDDRALLDTLARSTSDLATAVLSESTRLPVAQRRRDAARLAAERERLERELQRRSAGYLNTSTRIELPAVQRAVPADAALVEYFVYRPFDARAAFETGRQSGPRRYVAYVIRHTGDTHWKDLGTADEIDRSVQEFRSAVSDPKRGGAIRIASGLHRKLVAPLQPFFGDAKHLLISPDGPLNLVAFEALRTRTGRYLVEDFAVSYVTAGRDLLRMRAPRPLGKRSVLLANPDFGEPSAPSAAARSTVPGQDLTSIVFPPLAGTTLEAERVHALFPRMELLLAGRATERALKNIQAPRILHIATHGFFLPDAESRDSTVNPLLRSGLALSGANRRPASGDDGILTALEASSLNLWGTELVTLSACDTGVGVVRSGEGIYGLRRAFFLAGAESLVMSLWPVGDLITREMMVGYYTGLRQGLGRGAALRQMQRRILQRKSTAHPFYWASFIQAGAWTALSDPR